MVALVRAARDRGRGPRSSDATTRLASGLAAGAVGSLVCGLVDGARLARRFRIWTLHSPVIVLLLVGGRRANIQPIGGSGSLWTLCTWANTSIRGCGPRLLSMQVRSAGGTWPSKLAARCGQRIKQLPAPHSVAARRPCSGAIRPRQCAQHCAQTAGSIRRHAA